MEQERGRHTAYMSTRLTALVNDLIVIRIKNIYMQSLIFTFDVITLNEYIKLSISTAVLHIWSCQARQVLRSPLTLE